MLDRVRRAYEEILGDWAGWGTLSWMAACVLLARVHGFFSTKEKIMRAERIATLVNAVAVGGMKNKLRNQPIAIELHYRRKFTGVLKGADKHEGERDKESLRLRKGLSSLDLESKKGKSWFRDSKDVSRRSRY